jgi:23S rRNA (pseudouridine1915-N3)-methyltransferase
VLKTIAPTEHVILLDERGREVSSYDFADIIARAGDDGTPLTFCIGGPYGHGDAMRSRANDSIRLSRLVLNHQVAVVVLLEQLYRGWAIARGEPYHHV